jgi:hypothetical protein
MLVWDTFQPLTTIGWSALEILITPIWQHTSKVIITKVPALPCYKNLFFESFKSVPVLGNEPGTFLLYHLFFLTLPLSYSYNPVGVHVYWVTLRVCVRVREREKEDQIPQFSKICKTPTLPLTFCCNSNCPSKKKLIWLNQRCWAPHLS